jgi:midasin
MLVCPVSSNAFPVTTLSVLEQHSKHEPLKAAVHLFLRPNLIQFAADRQPPDMMTARLSHCYISISTAILDLSILDLPEDPATV